MTMKSWILVMMVMKVGVFADRSATKNHNEEAHRALCTVLKMAVGKWGTNGEGLSDPLKTALHQTIFGYRSEEKTVEKLRDTFPIVYKEGVGGLRGVLCGQPTHGGYQDNFPRWPGHSAPHDLVCLCTVGNEGWPLNETIPEKKKLCGKTEDELGGDTEGWDSSSKEKGEKQITATWDNITKECLQSDGKKGENLKEALETLTGKLKESNHYLLGEGTYSSRSASACTGSPSFGVCVKYYPTYEETKTWWVDLQKALIEDEKIQAQKKEENRKQQEEANQRNSPKTEALKSGNPNTNKTEQHRNETVTDKLRRFNLTSGTPIILPSPWLLRAILLI
ncbi:Variant surface glycoprotein [Trypanosoma congolense IL3000]|uniref:Variant surface glycoprotein n=1 Tax=Trypanosoma congolense (strain IL3000) TaxID=1068625 RepID=F9W7B2_TRYCI|nr:Variant surface glycoprotein [Trypanosoma congolense IL3000]